MVEGVGFLELLSEQEAQSRGVTPTDKLSHEVYKTIRQLTTIDQATTFNLFHVGVALPNILQMQSRDMLIVLRRLLQDGLISQLFRVEYRDSASDLSILPCFVAEPSDPKSTLSKIYTILLGQSTDAVSLWLEGHPALDKKSYRQDLLNDLQPLRRGKIEELYPYTLTDPLLIIHSGRFDLPPDPEMVRATLENLRRDLVGRKIILPIDNFGFMIYREDEYEQRFEIAEEIFLSRILPEGRKSPECRRELQAIAMEEAKYYLDEFAPRSVGFLIRRALVLRRALRAAAEASVGTRFPGALTLEILLSLEQRMEEHYQREWQQQSDQLYQRWRERITTPSNSWQESLLFISERERRAHSIELWRRLESDPVILHYIWQSREMPIHLYVRKDSGAFRAAVADMSRSFPEESWKVLAMKFCLDHYESNFPTLFDDLIFVQQYGRLLRRVYLSYIPWYHRLLLILGITLFQDSNFRFAREVIAGEQKKLQQQNHATMRKIEEEREHELQLKLRRIEQSGHAQRIVEKLDEIFFENRSVPTFADLLHLMPDTEPEMLSKLLDEEKFQLLDAASGRIEEQIILYPANQEWRNRVGKLKRLVEEIIAHGRQGQLSDIQKKIVERAGRVLNLIGKSRTSIDSKAEAIAAEGEDPYGKLQREIDRKRTREASPLDEEELEV